MDFFLKKVVYGSFEGVICTVGYMYEYLYGSTQHLITTPTYETRTYQYLISKLFFSTDLN